MDAISILCNDLEAKLRQITRGFFWAKDQEAKLETKQQAKLEGQQESKDEAQLEAQQEAQQEAKQEAKLEANKHALGEKARQMARNFSPQNHRPERGKVSPLHCHGVNLGWLTVGSSWGH